MASLVNSQIRSYIQALIPIVRFRGCVTETILTELASIPQQSINGFNDLKYASFPLEFISFLAFIQTRG